MASAAPAPFSLRFTANAPGDVTIAGNTVMTCPASTACTAARAGGAAQNNGFGMAFIDVDADPATFDSSSSQLVLPPGATVLFAGLYWGAKSVAGGAPGAAAAPSAAAIGTVLFAPPGGAYSTIAGTVLGTTPDSGLNYHAFADVTARVAAAGPGVYTAANVQAGRGTNTWGGWSLVVAYRDPAAPFRNLAVFDGYQFIAASNPAVTIPVSGFIAPPAGPVRARLGVVSYDGDKGSPGSTFLGDSLSLNGTVVSDALNPANDFFNSTLSRTGVRTPGNLPDYVNGLGFDADVVTVDGLIPNGATAATVALTTGGESYYPGVVTTAIDLFAPTLRTEKTVTDLDGGQVEPGDLLEYAVSLANTGLDAATGVTLTDAIPPGTAYEPGSLAITAGDGAGPATDPAGDDRAEGSAAGVTFRLGAGATAAAGGNLAIGAATAVRFRVRVGAGTPAGTVIPNTASVAFRGATTGTPFADTSAPAQVTVAGAPVLAARKSASLAVDADGDGAIGPGDTLGYSIVVTNSGNQPATGVVVSDSPPVTTRLVVGSVTTNRGGVTTGNAAGDTTVAVAVGTMLPGTSATVAFRARVAAPLPAGTTSIRNQATVTADGLPALRTDDPVTVTVGDPTVVPVGIPATTTLAIDARGPATARRGARATYCAVVVNRGRTAARSVRIATPVGPGTVVAKVPGGAVLRGGTLVWTTTRLAPGARRTVCFSLRLLGVGGQVRRPVVTAVAANARRVSDAVRTRLVGATAIPPQPAVTG